jgi:heme-degrading monooxygenase HmoA
MIARVWRGVTPESKAEEYLGYLKRTGLSDYQKIEGNKGVQVLKRAKDVLSEFVLISFWESIETIRQFAGEDYERAVYYPLPN